MKTFYSTLTVFLLTVFTAGAQINYSFSASPGTYVAISGTHPTLTASNPPADDHDDGFANGINLGFTFNYNGTDYTQINVNTNGFASFAPFSILANPSQDYYTADLGYGTYGPNNARPILAPLWDDLDLFSNQVPNVDITYTTTGAPGSQVFTLQWSRVYWDFSATDLTLEFQLRLFEADGSIEFQYHDLGGLTPSGVNNTRTAAIGITAVDTAYFDITGNYLSLNNSSASPTASSTVNTYTINAKPAEGQIYRFTRPNNNYYYRTVASGDWSNTSTWEASTSSTFAVGSEVLTFAAPDYLSKSITVRATHTVNLTDARALDETKVEAGGTVLVAANNGLKLNDGPGTDLIIASTGIVTLLSNATSTARFAHVLSTCTISGDVTVERYIPDDGKRAWRLLAVPVTTTKTIRETWQENGSAAETYGTLITSDPLFPADPNTNGFDLTSNSSSILTHNQASSSWSPIPSTKVPITNPGYMLFVRGDRTTTPLPSNVHPPAILRTTGQLRIGTQSPVAIAATGSYTLVGNPYAAPVDFETIAFTPNLSQSYYIWEANRAGTYGVGGYKLVERNPIGGYDPTPFEGTFAERQTLRYIHSGQAIFLKANGSPSSVVFTENSKSTQVSYNNPFRVTNFASQMMANILIVDANNVGSLVDGVRVRFDNSYSLAVTDEDILKLNNFSNENLGLRRDGKIMIVEKRPDIVADDTLFLNLTNTTVRSYRFQIFGENMPNALVAYLVDKYQGKQTPINIGGVTDIDFSVTTDAASAAVDRFMIVFRAASTLPITLSSVKAYQQNTNIAVEWNVQNENGIKNYDVEKSSDGRSFATVGTKPATGNNTSAVNYKWLDVNPVVGNNFYRIRSVELSGKVTYSQVVKVSIGKGKSEFQVYPNPVVNGIVNLQFVNQPKGVYNVRLINNLGQELFSKQITHEQGSSSETIQLSSSVGKGSYRLEIISPDDSKRIINILR